MIGAMKNFNSSVILNENIIVRLYSPLLRSFDCWFDRYCDRYDEIEIAFIKKKKSQLKLG